MIKNSHLQIILINAYKILIYDKNLTNTSSMRERLQCDASRNIVFTSFAICNIADPILTVSDCGILKYKYNIPSTYILIFLLQITEKFWIVQRSRVYFNLIWWPLFIKPQYILLIAPEEPTSLF